METHVEILQLGNAGSNIPFKIIKWEVRLVFLILVQRAVRNKGFLIPFEIIKWKVKLVLFLLLVILVQCEVEPISSTGQIARFHLKMSIILLACECSLIPFEIIKWKVKLVIFLFLLVILV